MKTFLGSKSYVSQTADNNSFVTILTVPNGFHVKVDYLLITAKSTATVDGQWVHDVGGVTTDTAFLHSKNLQSGESIEFGGTEGKYLIMTDADQLQLKSTAADVTVILSYNLYPHESSNIDL